MIVLVVSVYPTDTAVLSRQRKVIPKLQVELIEEVDCRDCAAAWCCGYEKWEDEGICIDCGFAAWGVNC
eukprot:203156-Rhodomonas_salina.2